MKIFLKYIAKCMTEKKARLILLLVSIAMSTGLLITILGAADILVDSFGKPMIESFDGKEVYVKSKDNEVFISIKDIKEEGIKNIQGEIKILGTEYDKDDVSVVLRGREKESIDEEKILEGNIKLFTENKCVISKRISEEKDLNIDDKISFTIAGEKKEFQVSAIIRNDGAFYGDSKNQFTVYIPYEYIAKDLNVEGKYNYVTANKVNDDIEDCKDKFNEENDKYEIDELYNAEVIKEQVSSMNGQLYAMLAIVVLMSTIIIYGSFKLTVTERLSTIGTFLSQGATSGTIEKIMFLESSIYGVLGGILGCLLGFGGLNLINYATSPLMQYGIVEKLIVNPVYFIIGLIFAIILSIASALLPILRIRKLQVKDVILNNVTIEMHISWKKFVVGFVLIIISTIVAVMDNELSTSLSLICIPISLIGLILMYPKIIDVITNVFYKMFKGKSKVVVFALNNLRTSKILMGNITLIIISMLSIFMITSIGGGMTKLVTEAYSKLNYDISITSIQGIEGLRGEGTERVSDKIIKILEESKDVKSDSIMELNRVFAESVRSEDGKNKAQMGVVDASDLNDYREYNEYLGLNNEKNKEMYDNFVDTSIDENKVIVSEKISNETQVKVGEKIKLTVNGIEKTFEVAGIYDGKMLMNGYGIIMDKKLAEKQFNTREANEIDFKVAGKSKEVKEELLDDLKPLGVSLITKDEAQEANELQNQMMVSMLSIFSYLAILIAALGVLNNIIIGFLQRKKELAVLGSVGMTNGNRNIMLIIESALSVIWSTGIAVLYALLGLKLIEKVLILAGMPLELSLNFSSVPVYFIASLVIILLATMPIVFKSKKLSIVEELRCE